MMYTMVLVAVLVSLAGRWMFHYFRWKSRANALTANIPTWNLEIPFLGHAYKFKGSTEATFNRLVEISNLASAGNGRFKIWMGPTLLLFTTVPEDIRIVNNTFIDKSYMYKFAALWVKNGITSAPGDIWKKTIKRVHNAFSPAVTDGFQDVYNHYARKITNNLKSESGNPPFDASSKVIMYVVLEAICHTVMGMKNVDSSMVSEEYYVAFKRTTTMLMKRAMNPMVYPDFIYELTSSYREFKQSVEVLQNLSKTIVETRRKEFEERRNNCKDGTLDPNERPKFISLLDNFLEHTVTDPTLTNEQLQADADNFIAAGFETTAVTMLLILIMLGSHPEAQQKLYAEINAIYQGSDRDVTKEDLERMPYCDAVVCETLRMYPVVPIVVRHADKDLKLDDYTIPKGTDIVDFLYGACRSHHSWGEDANLFVPERWFKEKQPDPAAFAAFSYGKRVCIAKKSALAFLKIIVAHCIRDLEFKSQADQLRLEINVTLYPVSGAGRNIQVFKRNQACNCTK